MDWKELALTIIAVPLLCLLDATELQKNVQFVTIKLRSYVFGVEGVSFLETKNVQVVLFKEDWYLLNAWMQSINIDRR